MGLLNVSSIPPATLWTAVMVGGIAAGLPARYTVVLLPFTWRADDVTARWIGTSPGLVAPELIGTATDSVVWPAGNVTDSFTGVKYWPDTEGVAAAPPGNDPLVAAKSIVIGLVARSGPEVVVRTNVTSRAPVCWLM
jgi:hypothetical protein